ncbi:two-component system OmpR family response regulator [Litoreibacter ponti]|uniref:Two-component system OmpR family response regulator n=1 Tax=Litoreibacter ponti TaxID=1510457 RepID=A0A2T6BEB7_9RHOB|nr:response regulator transcription factor [Litoreibacter ponti]PTX54396.1 two-component system OmpR family response regulator [Litoreibacter ponti]
MRITLIEDTESLRKGLTYRLEDEGHVVDALADGLDADDFLRHERSDLVILDINLPGQSGLEVLRALRRRADPRPVILLTARGETEDRVAGLDAGADDYLVKPFAIDELLARVRALARRGTQAPTRSVALGPLVLELEPLQLSSEAGPLDVPRRELMLLAALTRPPGSAVSKGQLLDAVYGTGTDADEKVIEVYVSRLRKRLRPHGVSITVRRGIGYALETGP